MDHLLIFRSDIVLNNLSASAFTKKIIINTNGKPYRPVLYIDDLCKIIISCLFKNIKIIQKKYIMLDILEKNFSILQIANMVRKIFKYPIIVLNNPSHDERSYKVNFDLLSKDFFDVLDFKIKIFCQI